MTRQQHGHARHACPLKMQWARHAAQVGIDWGCHCSVSNAMSTLRSIPVECFWLLAHVDWDRRWSKRATARSKVARVNWSSTWAPGDRILDRLIRTRRMKRHRRDAALVSMLGLLAIAGVLHSATGSDQIVGVLLAFVLTTAAIIVGSLLIDYRRRTQRRMIPALAATIFALVVITSVTATHWPMRVTYALSRDSFDAVAQRIRQGERVTTPLRAGLFTIRGVELSHHDIVCLWTHPDPGGSTGFVQCRGDSVPFNLWSLVRLDDRWQYISED